ncbi:MAG: proline--tRNA ligase, partial [Chloroflexota bacterium]|nr:proline--tRNA ligase [Chloroflexota bacterium]
EAAAAIRRELSAFRVHFDGRDEYKPGWKFSEWELRGVPLRIEIGPRDVASRQVTLVRRDNRERRAVPMEGAAQAVGELLQGLQRDLLGRARDFLASNTVNVTDMEEMQEAIAARKFVWADWCGQMSCELAVKEKTGGTIRNIPLERDLRPGRCVYCGQPSDGPVIFARAY